jgi:hypothetical protein
MEGCILDSECVRFQPSLLRSSRLYNVVYPVTRHQESDIPGNTCVDTR